MATESMPMFAERGCNDVEGVLKFDVDASMTFDVPEKPSECIEAEATATTEGDPDAIVCCGMAELAPVTGTGLDAIIDSPVGVILFAVAKEVGVSTESFKGTVTTEAAGVSVTVN